MGSHWLRNSLITLLLAATVVWLITGLLSSNATRSTVAFGDVVADAKAGRVDTIEVDGQKLTVTYVERQNGQPVVKSSEIAPNTDLLKFLSDQGIALTRKDAATNAPAVNLEFKQGTNWSAWIGLLLNILPFLLIGLFIFVIMRQSQSSTSQAMGFSKSRARLTTGARVSVTFDDVAGVDEAKEELSEVVEFLKFPAKFAALGAHVPRGVLLLGPPGTGKTLLARAVAGEAGVPFFSISGSEFVEMFVGVGAGRVRDLFDQAKKNAPCIVFIDEIDAVGRQRGTGLGGSHDEREQTLNQILVEMDGFEPGTNVIVLAATNRPDILDPALLRPGRFDRKVVLDSPDIKGREAILRVHTRGKPIAEDVTIATLAKSTPGFSGADLANLVNEAAILAARRNKDMITMSEFEEAVERVIAGPERRSRVMTVHERELTAYHEGGHAVVAHFLEHHDRPQKVTIIARGLSGGHTRFLPEEEARYRTQSMLRDELCAALAGQAAEKIVFGESSTGPSNDIEQVTQLARAMVTRWGMSERLGPRTFGRTDELIFLGREISETRNYSDRIAEEIDDEVRRIIEAEQERGRELLLEHRPLLDKLAHALVEFETLEGKDLDRLLGSDPAVPWAPEDAGHRNADGSDVKEAPIPDSTADGTNAAPGLAWEGEPLRSGVDAP